jgi:hypothetical protein
MTQRVKVADAGERIHNLSTFDANNLRAILPTDGGKYQYVGNLDLAVQRQYFADVEQHGIAYLVLSYETPIAWVTRNNIRRVPDVRYSPTTTNHQDIVRREWAEYL